MIEHFNFSENEFIFAPVIRQFIVLQTDDENEKLILRQIMDEKINTRPAALASYFSEHNESLDYVSSGRYFALDPHLANRYFYRPFGLSIRVNNWNWQSNQYELAYAQGPENSKVIQVYLKNGHYELNAAPILASSEEGLSGDFAKVFDTLSFSNSSLITHQQLARVFCIVRGSGLGVREEFNALRAKTLANTQEMNSLPDNRYSLFVLLYTMLDYKLQIVQRFAASCIKALTYYAHDLEYSEYLVDLIVRTIDDLLESNLDNPIEIEQRLNDHVYAQLPQEVDLQGQGNPPRLEPRISLGSFNRIIHDYQTSYWLWDRMIQLISFGYWRHMSGTMAALIQLLNASQDKEFISQTEIANAINHEANRDSLKQNRYSFFVGNELRSEKFGTDKILSAIKQEIRASVLG